MRTIKIVSVLFLCAVSARNLEAQGVANAPPTRTRVSSRVLASLVEYKAVPQYPVEALKLGVQGDVLFKILMDQKGRVVLSNLVDGDFHLQAACKEALWNFRFKPYLLQGNPVMVESSMLFRFTIAKNGDEAGSSVEYVSDFPFRSEFKTGLVIGKDDKGVVVGFPKRTSGAGPVLPRELAEQAGFVDLAVTIGEDGAVRDIQVLVGDEPFLTPSLEAVRRYTYEPRMQDGKPTTSATVETLYFGPQQ
jgi:hypothetical protein